jgi:hypothetical protein
MVFSKNYHHVSHQDRKLRMTPQKLTRASRSYYWLQDITKESK